MVFSLFYHVLARRRERKWNKLALDDFFFFFSLLIMCSSQRPRQQARLITIVLLSHAPKASGHAGTEFENHLKGKKKKKP